ncbi:MAG: response regulator transcription factor [Acidobacteriota bacterium]
MTRILLVDDDPRFARVLKYQLSEMGFAVDQVGDGRAALQSCREADYSLMLADVNVPALSGLSFLQLIKLRKPGLPIVVLSAFSSMENVATALRYGANDFLEKPCEVAMLRERIDRLIARSRSKS